MNCALTKSRAPVAAHPHLAEVRDVEQPDRLAHRRVLLQHAAARVLDRHLPAAEVGELGAQRHVPVVQRRVLQERVDGRHGAEATGRRRFGLGCGDLGESGDETPDQVRPCDVDRAEQQQPRPDPRQRRRHRRPEEGRHDQARPGLDTGQLRVRPHPDARTHLARRHRRRRTGRPDPQGRFGRLPRRDRRRSRRGRPGRRGATSRRRQRGAGSCRHGQRRAGAAGRHRRRAAGRRRGCALRRVRVHHVPQEVGEGAQATGQGGHGRHCAGQGQGRRRSRDVGQDRRQEPAPRARPDQHRAVGPRTGRLRRHRRLDVSQPEGRRGGARRGGPRQGQVRRPARRRHGVGEPAATGPHRLPAPEGHAPPRPTSARASPSTPAASRSSRPRTWTR